MKKLMMGAMLAGSMVLTGCTSTCDDLADSVEVLQEKAKPCDTTGGEPTAFDVNRCESNLDKCSNEDREELGKFADCLRELPTCSPATQDNFNAATLGCALTVSGKLSDGCATAIFGE